MMCCVFIVHKQDIYRLYEGALAIWWALHLISYTCRLATGCKMAPRFQHLVLCRRAHLIRMAMVSVVYVFTLHLEAHDHAKYNTLISYCSAFSWVWSSPCKFLIPTLGHNVKWPSNYIVYDSYSHLAFEIIQYYNCKINFLQIGTPIYSISVGCHLNWHIVTTFYWGFLYLPNFLEARSALGLVHINWHCHVIIVFNP